MLNCFISRMFDRLISIYRKSCHQLSNNKMYFGIFFKYSGNSLAVQCLGLRALTARGPCLIPGLGTKIPQATGHSQKKKNPSALHNCVLSYVVFVLCIIICTCWTLLLFLSVNVHLDLSTYLLLYLLSILFHFSNFPSRTSFLSASYALEFPSFINHLCFV